MDTSAIMVNTSITKTSSLFEKQRGAQHGPGESLWVGDSIWLTGWLTLRVLCTTELPKEEEAPVPTNAPFYKGGPSNWNPD